MAISSSYSTCDKSFCTDYILLNKHEEAGFWDIFSILFSGDIKKRTFIECPNGKREPLRTFIECHNGKWEPLSRRWIIFVSSMAIKFLQLVSKRLTSFGSALEYWLNLLSQNEGFFNLILNTFKGVVRRADSSSASYLSFVGCLDRRLQLMVDTTDEGSDRRPYYAAISVMAAKISYENPNFIHSAVEDHWKMNFLGFFDFWNDYQGKATTQAFVMDDSHGTIVVSFRGTESFDADAWSSDFDISWYELPGLGKIHGGFMKALGLQRSLGWPKDQPEDRKETAYYGIRKLLKQRLEKDDQARFIVTGHSLGGALAALFPAILALHEESWLLDRLEGVYTYGQPRVGDDRFGEFMKAVMEKHSFDFFRFVYSFDIVPRLPYDNKTMMFRHFGTCVYYNSFYQGKVVAEEPDKNYFSIIWLIPKLTNAWWELIRSFVIPYIRGEEFRETGLIRVIRVMGLLNPGLPAHCPPDYVNSTWLASSKVFAVLSDRDRDTTGAAHKALKSE